MVVLSALKNIVYKQGKTFTVFAVHLAWVIQTHQTAIFRFHKINSRRRQLNSLNSHVCRDTLLFN